eukprot:TRINITY_DN61997_c0_g1_i1.p1 TRINITY_DN61997_c0_g1~~TRINITY_DN61997_c0_g1_i1.p1  ORF type:complete len:252 (-),score=52.86 TRINITY_DN61997_c0_g1_i1:278-1033(-)
MDRAMGAACRLPPGKKIFFRVHHGELAEAEDNPFLFSSLQVTPDVICLSLSHPAFGEYQNNQILEAYAAQVVPGNAVQLVDPNAGVFTEMEAVDVGPDEVTVQLVGTSWLQSGKVSTRTVPRSMVFGGWPVTSHSPAQPVRVLEKHVAFMWPGAVRRENVKFLQKSANEEFAELDPETGIAELLHMAEADSGVLWVRVENQEYSLQFDAEADAKAVGVTWESRIKSAGKTFAFVIVVPAGLCGLIGVLLGG